jgi:hypothetical protein
MSDLMKDCLVLQYKLEINGVGKLPFVLHADASVCQQFLRKTDVGRVRHLDVKYMLVQESMEKGIFSFEKISY